MVSEFWLGSLLRPPRFAGAFDHLFDISLDRAFVERLAEDCTRFQLDPVHLMDVAEDALA